MKRLTVGIYALHYDVLYLCTLNKSKLTRAAAASLRYPSGDKYLNVMWKWNNVSMVKSNIVK